MSVIESYVGLEFIFATLTNDATFNSLALGGAWRGSAPVGTPMPLCIISFQSGIDVLTANARRMMINAMFQVKASGQAANTPAVAALAAAIDALLARTSGYATGGYALACFRESVIQYDEDIGSDKYTHMGGLYRLLLQQAP